MLKYMRVFILVGVLAYFLQVKREEVVMKLLAKLEGCSENWMINFFRKGGVRSLLQILDEIDRASSEVD